MSAWPLLVALVLRVIAWMLVPAGRFASDEESYFTAATSALAGRQDLFWPPFTGWLIALSRWLLHTDSLPALRMVWIAMDLGSVWAIHTLARRAAVGLADASLQSAGRVAFWSALAYAAYLPAISYSQFMTSETPALLLLLCGLLLLTSPPPGVIATATAGLFTGLLTLTRPSLLPLLLVWPLAFARRFDRSALHVASALRVAAVFVAVGGGVVGAYAARNWVAAGAFTVSNNSAYNLYIGNRDLYAEDLNLFNPRATAEQIEFRRQQRDGTLEHPALPPHEWRQQAIAWITAHPAEFLRRALGRLARVFVPRTDVLELVGGETAAGVFSPRALAVLVIANLQWALILAGGTIGLFVLRHSITGRLFLLTIAGVVAPCLLAISKPRYSFVFDPLLIAAAVQFARSPAAQWRGLGRRERGLLAAVFAFLAWGWIAWLIFAVTSRTAA